ncbi:Amine oxidase [Schizosaccharomyces pombe]|uniref:Copper amine oxidase 1 n=1 Tax=Schizosaccharomyces pombe (strain 972 / ATCC 24843) TaxID=284812 RepID=CAO1_SCHPO|nr:Cu(2+) amine oxidase Cao1 [Schizosaccharomyces pombe]Q9P7F2.1 RecName: Full=Copper amine oxidase 1 [Schizosaccharomyces pombe 972h-]CAB83008.1 copper amine oxidase Cao1 [Schizosaccharomyces pombe]|eukprot:NP_593985.1 Cu(2+) amine oxidase Cao1 [Schizosaccharomyces pombe]
MAYYPHLPYHHHHHTSVPGERLSDPLDPLSADELKLAVEIIRHEYPSKHFAFNVVTLEEPPKAKYLHWKYSKEDAHKPERIALAVLLEKGVPGILEARVNLTKAEVIQIEHITGVCPILTADMLVNTEQIVRKDPAVIEQCILSGVPPDQMDHVYCDPWTIGYDERYGNTRRMQQAMMYYRSNEDDSQYSHPLDFCPIIDTEDQKVVAIDIPPVRRPLSKHKHSNFNKKDIEAELGKMREVKPISVTQPEGVNFRMKGRYIEWQNFRMHIGFNYREGIVLSDISYNDNGHIRPLFYRMSIAEMVVPYGNPEHPHQRKHAFDLGEYGAGYLTNPLALGCDCKGVIHYLDAHFVNNTGEVETVKNAICIHEEDDGVLFKHSDFRDKFRTTISARGIRLVISQIFTAANYEYMVYWIFHMDGVIECELKLTGILNTYAMNEGEDLKGWGTQVYPQVNAHNHQHLFCLRLNPMLDGYSNSVAVVDGVSGPGEPGSKENYYGNAFTTERTVPKTVKEAICDYNSDTSRTWDICNPNKLHPYSGKPVSYKLVSRETPRLMARPGSLVSNRAGFARHHIHVTPYKDGQIYPAGDYVPQTSGEPTKGLPEWIAEEPDASVDNTDIVVWHTFGITHFPAPEDFPLMPAEPIRLLLRPRNFFLRNPALDVPPSKNVTTSEVKQAHHHGNLHMMDMMKSLTDATSEFAFGEKFCEKHKGDHFF